MQVTPGHLFSQLDFRDIEESDERLVLELDNRPDLVNRRGALQGGLVATLIDIAAGRLADRHVGPGQDVTTADMTVHFLAPILEGPARAEATVVRAGRRLSVIAVEVTDATRGRLVARATVSFAAWTRAEAQPMRVEASAARTRDGNEPPWISQSSRAIRIEAIVNAPSSRGRGSSGASSAKRGATRSAIASS